MILARLIAPHDKLTITKAAGVTIGLIGVAFLMGVGARTALSGQNMLGESACLLAALSYALAGIYGRRLRDIEPIAAATGQVTASAAILIPPVLIADAPWTLPMPSIEAWVAIFGIALLCTALAYVLYFEILRAAGPTNLLLVTFLIPVTAVALGILVLSEQLASRHIIGIALIAVGLSFIDGRLPNLIRHHMIGRSTVAN